MIRCYELFLHDLIVISGSIVTIHNMKVCLLKQKLSSGMAFKEIFGKLIKLFQNK